MTEGKKISLNETNPAETIESAPGDSQGVNFDARRLAEDALRKALDLQQAAEAYNERIYLLEQVNEDLRIKMGRLAEKIERLDLRIDEILGKRTRERRGLARTAHAKHVGLAERYRVLIEQRIQQTARSSYQGQRSSAQLRERVARSAQEICQALFASADIDYRALTRYTGSSSENVRTMIHGSIQEARLLRAEIESIGISHDWDFESSESLLIDELRQEPWLSCSPKGAIKFLVSPGYVVDGQMLCRQRVFTDG
jgi:hypothetical protein